MTFRNNKNSKQEMCFPFQNKIKSENISAKFRVLVSSCQILASIKVMHNNQVQWHTLKLFSKDSPKQFKTLCKFKSWKDHYCISRVVAEEVKQSLIRQATEQGWMLII